MKMNSDLEKKKKEAVLEEEDDEETEKEQAIFDSTTRKRLFSLMLIIVGIMAFLFIVLYLISLTSNRNYTYSDVEEIMKKAAESYFVDYPESLPKNDGSGVEIDANNLVAAGKMKALSEYLGEEESCGGSVKVERINSQYVYVPYLKCGSYTTIQLIEKVLEQEKVTSGYGLYSVNGAHIYRGETVNNYVSLEKSTWRIVKITANGHFVLIHDEGLPYTQPWDDRYNEEYLYEAGINQYSASRVKEYLERIYVNPVAEDGEDILSNSDKAKMVSFNVCTGKRSATSEKKNNTEECTSALKNQKMGLLTLSDYLYASVDPNCKSASTKSCKNYNYLTMKNDWWLVTANKDDTSTVYCVTRNGDASLETAAKYGIVRPVIYLKSDVLYESGDGTKENPFKVK